MKFKRFIKESKEVVETSVVTESIDDLDQKCETCGTLLNDMGTCPKCDDGEEDYEDREDLDEKLQGSHEDITFLANEFDEALTKEGFDYIIEMRDGFKINVKSDKFDDIKKFADEFFKKWNLAVDVEDAKDGSFNMMLKKGNVTVQESTITEELSNMEKLIKAFPELAEETVAEELTEELSNVEKLIRAYPELADEFNADSDLKEELSNIEKLKRAFPELNFDDSITEEADPEWDEYDDSYDFEDDDVEQDRVHAALYGGDRMYCDCGAKLVMDEWGGYCPECDAEEAFKKHIDDDTSDLTEQVLTQEDAIEAAKKLLAQIPECEGICYGIDRKKGGREFFTPMCITHEEAERIAKTENMVYVLWNKNLR